MAYDEKLAVRVRKVFGRDKRIKEKNMFGGLSFLLNGKMCCGVIKNELVVRVGPELYEKALSRPHARPMDFTGRLIKGFVFVGPAGCKTGKALSEWVRLGTEHAASLKNKKRTQKMIS